MVKVRGVKEHVARVRKITGPQAVHELRKAVFDGADMVAGEAIHLITQGAVSGKFHVPSLPGQPPKNDTGDLKRGIQVESGGPLKALVTSSAPHAVPLEVGTSKMAARPYMAPAVKHTRKAIVAFITKAVNRIIAGRSTLSQPK
ncbi:MAG: HK97 gp10 family phage protein [Alphaproteobacteria bacterium]|nr:HK97 gp10 family phage protein [Alphaproteobacteria bacterium]